MGLKTRVAMLIVAIALLALISLSILGFVSFPFITPERDISEKVKNLYELSNPGTVIDIVAVTEQSGLYKVVLKASDITGTTYREVYVTKDGKLLTENIILVEESIAQIERMRRFVDCLEEKGVRIFGVSNQTASLLQLNVLGKYSVKLFTACDINMQSCLAAKVTQVPSVVIGESVEPGVKTIDWFERATGCEF